MALKRKTNKGFTLIELMVSVSLFALMVAAVSGVFISNIKNQKQILAIQEMTGQASYGLEFMSRALRMAVKQTGEGISCLSNEGENYELTNGGAGILFINHLDNDDCQQFFLENNRLKYRRGIGTLSPVTSDLTSPSLRVNILKFNLIGGSQADDQQPRVTVFLKIIRNTGAGNSPVSTTVQTTLSQRNLDIVY